MPARFCVLASGSTGNAALIDVDGFVILLDFGIGPRKLTARLETIGISWNQIRAAVLTHTHGDHWNNFVLGHLLRHRIPLHCHGVHQVSLYRQSESFEALAQNNLVRVFDDGEELSIGPCQVRPFPVLHDDRTFGYRFDGPAGIFGPLWSLAYAADLGTWDDELVPHLQDVELLALEFNHDVELQWMSSRPAMLIHRVLGPHGHLSNEQAGQLLNRLLEVRPGQLRHLVQLHLSQECNTWALARTEAEQVRKKTGGGFEIHTASASRPTRWLDLDAAPRKRRSLAMRAFRKTPAFVQPYFPEWLE